jgi:apolipoprotein N-acyltransferase
MANPAQRAGHLSRCGGAAAAVLVVLACYPPVDAGPWLGFVAYTPLYALLERTRTAAGAFLLGFALGGAEVLVLGGWLAAGLARPALALATVAVFFGLTWGLVTWLLHWLLRHRAFPLLIWAVIPAAEWARGANPWCPVGYLTTAQMAAGNLWFVQMADVTACAGLSLLLCASSWWAWRVVRDRGRGMLAWLSCLAVLHAVGYWRWTAWQAGEGDTLPVAVVQEFAPRNRGGDSTGDKAELFRRIRQTLAGADCRLLFLPEGTLDQPRAAPGELVESSRPTPAEIGSLLAERSSGPRYAVCGVTIGAGGDATGYRNSVVLIEAGGGVLGVVDKRFPAPVGEMTPLDGIPVLENLGRALSEAEGSFQSGPTGSTLSCPGGPRLAVAVCHEQMLPELWRQRGPDSPAGVDLQVIVADTRWFGYAGQERRLSRAARRLLAVRWRRPLLYAANGGSEWISASGCLEGTADARDPGVTFELKLSRSGPSIPEVVPAWFVPGFALLVTSGWLIRGKSRGRENAPGNSPERARSRSGVCPGAGSAAPRSPAS